MKIPPLALLGVVLAVLDFCYFAHAVSFRQQLGHYQDSVGVQRQRLQVDLGTDLKHLGLISQSAYSLSFAEDRYRNGRLLDNNVDDSYVRELYEGGDRLQRTLSLGFLQTWNTLTESRLSYVRFGDERTAANTYGLGASRWIWDESIRFSLDYSQTSLERPEFEILGQDVESITPPPQMQARAASLGMRHLATPSTIMDYTVSQIESSDRPAAQNYIVSIRQFIPALQGAVHGQIARAINRGVISKRTPFGEVDAWIVELAYLQTLWQGGRTRFSVRQYREEEVTATDRNRYYTGSDLLSAAFSQELNVLVAKTPLSIELGHSQYRTSDIDAKGTRIVARTFEAGVSAKF